MKRIALVNTTTEADGGRTPTLPPLASSWVSMADFGNRMLVKYVIPDGTPPTANTIADITMEDVLDDNGQPTGQKRQVAINPEPLTPAQRTQAKSFLQSNGVDVSRFDGDGVDDREKLLRFILRRAAGRRDMTTRELLDGWDA